MHKETKVSYKNMVIGESCEVNENRSQHEEEMAEIKEEANKICIEEHKVGGYECLEFMSSVMEEKRIVKPWEKGNIIKMLGRKIGYKALENHIQQLWA